MQTAMVLRSFVFCGGCGSAAAAVAELSPLLRLLRPRIQNLYEQKS